MESLKNSLMHEKITKTTKIKISKPKQKTEKRKKEYQLQKKTKKNYALQKAKTF